LIFLWPQDPNRSLQEPQSAVNARLAVAPRHYNIGDAREENDMVEQIATLAGACFWCIEAVFDDITGVVAVESGYIGGHVVNPTYRQVCGGDTGHAEAIRVHFDGDQIGYGELLDIFFAVHDPTQLNRQGNDVGPQYRSAIFPSSLERESEARAAILRAQADWDRPIVTTIEPDGPWHPAEDYHQEYFAREGNSNPYCQWWWLPSSPSSAKAMRRG
jgi:peptide-methionine (S)-S-oxide reductase